jgi:hypothetical protein
VALGGKKVYAVKRIFKPDDLILTTGHFKTACDPTVLYANLSVQIIKVLERMGVQKPHTT